MRWLVTRPEPDGLKLKGLLEARGHEATVEPLLHVSFDNSEAIELDGAAALIATSRNGLRALVGRRELRYARRLPLFAVGVQTAREAERMGFERVLVGPGTAAGLVPAIASVLDPSEGVLMHLAGERLAFDLKGELEALGFRVIQPVVYRMRAAEALSESTIDQINDREIDGVILMSPQTAAIYARLIVRHRLTLPARRLAHACLSEAVAERLAPLGQIAVEIAAAPTLEEMLALVEWSAAQSDR
jgi:uroporphyrinogen-III synthase